MYDLKVGFLALFTLLLFASVSVADPELTWVEPDMGEQGMTLRISITGQDTYFRYTQDCMTIYAEVYLEHDGDRIDCDVVSTNGNTLIRANLEIPEDAEVDTWDVCVDQVQDHGIVTLENGFTILRGTLHLVPLVYETIQAAVEASDDRDTVLVGEGTYYESLNFLGRDIVIGSLYLTTGDENHIVTTIIDGNDDGSVVTFTNGEDSSAVLTGLTIQNGSSVTGGGIYISADSHPTIDHCVITRNRGRGFGGGIACCDNSNPTISRCLIANNSGNLGAGIFCRGNSHPLVVNCTISENSANNDGGGIYMIDSGLMDVVNSIIWGNTPQQIYFHESGDPNAITVWYSDVEGGQLGVEYNHNGAAIWEEGNIDEDPQFIDVDNRDYHLTEDSPCIDTGDPDSPLDPDNTRADMGAYYLHHESYVDTEPVTPDGFDLYAYPNPFNNRTGLSVHAIVPGSVFIEVFDLQGRRVYEDVQRISIGNNRIALDGKQLGGAGVYLARVMTFDETQTVKLVYLP